MPNKEEISTKAKLSKLHCPFTWEILDSVIKHSLVHQKQDDENDEDEIDDEKSYPLEQLLISLFKCYKALLSANNNEVTKRIEKAGEILKQIQQKYSIQYLFFIYNMYYFLNLCYHCMIIG